MSTEQRETDEPNDAGFAGDPTTPQPEPESRPIEQIDAEAIAVPAGDLIHPIAEVLEGIGGHDDDEDSR